VNRGTPVSRLSRKIVPPLTLVFMIDRQVGACTPEWVTPSVSRIVVVNLGSRTPRLSLKPEIFVTTVLAAARSTEKSRTWTRPFRSFSKSSLKVCARKKSR
jgi:hypothetical protein